MKLTRKQIEKYNKPATIAVVSLYPKRGEIYSSGLSGVASYTKNVVRELGEKVVVIGERLSNNEEIYEEENTLVVRVWDSNKPIMWLQILSVLRQLTRVKSLLIHFDFSMYGGMLTSALFLPFLFLAKILGFRVSVVSHHVIKDVGKLSGQVGLGEGMSAVMKTQMYNLVFKGFYWLLGIISEKIVVLEEPLKDKLIGVVREDKLVAIPHAVDKKLKSVSKAVARYRLGYRKDEEIVLFFGFVNWFKGADIFAKSVKNIKSLNGRKVRFVMAGGESPTMKSKAFYREFYKKVTDSVRASNNLQLTGYVPQNKIADYFAAADLVVFPYRDFMCASGVMSLVFSYKKPFVISDRLRPMLLSKDISDSMKQVGLRSMDMTFLLNKGSMIEVMERVLENGLKNKMKKLAGLMREKRSFTATANLYGKLLTPDSKALSPQKTEGVLAYVVEE